MSAIYLIDNYCKDVKNFKIWFLENCHVEQKYEAYKIWSHWLIRNLCFTNYVHHLIPEPAVVENDIPILREHLKEKNFVGDIETYLNCVQTTIQYLYEKYHDLMSTLRNNTSMMITFNQVIKYRCYEKTQTNGKKDKVHMYKFFRHFSKFEDIVHTYLIIKHMNINLKNGILNYGYVDLFLIGFNYYIIDGNSLQWCTPFNVMTYLNTTFDCKTELFASPMNSLSENYYSLFEIDKQFGAQGSFFTEFEKDVSVSDSAITTYQINPPFIGILFEKSSQIILNILRTTSNKLLFIYIMPDWTDCIGYKLLKESEYLIDEIILNENEHFYYQSTNYKVVKANFKTHVMFIGNVEINKNNVKNIENMWKLSDANSAK